MKLGGPNQSNVQNDFAAISTFLMKLQLVSIN